MLLSPDPQTYWPLLGIKSRTSFLLGPRKSGVGGNEALFKSIQKLNNNDWRNLDQTTKKMFSYLRAGGNQKFGAVEAPESLVLDVDVMLEDLGERDELWTSILTSIEMGANAVAPEHFEEFQLSRMKMWGAYLSSQKIWKEGMQQTEAWEISLELIRGLEFSDTKSIQIALYLLERATTEDQTTYARFLLQTSALLFVAACADADLDFAEGNSVFEWFLPCVEEGLIVPPLRRWMMYAKKILGVETQQETTDILLGFQCEGSSRDREGKKLWAFGGVYEQENSGNKKLYLPSGNQFTKMTKAVFNYVEIHKPENVRYAQDLKICGIFVTFLSNLYAELADLSSDKERMMLFDDYTYFYQIARETKGPPPRAPGGG